MSVCVRCCLCQEAAKLQQQLNQNNDIILCDGGCSRAYHALTCCTPPVDVEQLDPDDGWLCPACEAKADVLRAINAEFGYEYEQEVNWGEIFAMSVCSGGPFPSFFTQLFTTDASFLRQLCRSNM